MKQENVFPVALSATEQSQGRLKKKGQRANGKIHSIWVKPCHKGNINEPEVLREGGKEEARGNGSHMDLRGHRHHSYAVHLMKQSNPEAHELLVRSHSRLIFSPTLSRTQ